MGGSRRQQARRTGVDLAALRREYADAGLREADLDPDPMVMFGRWLDDSLAAGLHEPNAMVVATVSAEGRPSSRMVLLKGVTADGFVFYTGTGSRKAVELATEPRCALLFPWHPLERQVRAEGAASRLPREAVAAYFATRPRASQLGAWASHQSRVVSGREELAAAYAEAETRFAGRDVPVPEEWGGYAVRPDLVEFWQGRPGRMHDRLAYRRRSDAPAGHSAWTVERLAP